MISGCDGSAINTLLGMLAIIIREPQAHDHAPKSRKGLNRISSVEDKVLTLGSSTLATV